MQVVQSVGHVTGDGGFRALANESPTLLGSERFLGLVAAQTAAQAVTFPAAASYTADTGILVADLVGGVSSTNTFTLNFASGDKINGVSNGTVVLNGPFQTCQLRTDGNGNWLASVSGGGISSTAAAKYTLNSTSGATTAAAGDLTGANFVSAAYSAVGAANLTTRTAAQMIADAGLKVGDSYMLLITNTSGGTTTLVAGSGVTLTGTMTLATNTTRLFNAKVSAAGAITIQSVSVGTIS